MCGQIFKKIIISVQIDPQFFRYLPDKLPGNKLQLHCIPLAGFLPGVSGHGKQLAQKLHLVLCCMGMAVLGDQFQDILCHLVLAADIFSADLHVFPLLVPVNHNFQIKQHFMKRIVRQVTFMKMFLLCDYLLEHGSGFFGYMDLPGYKFLPSRIRSSI